MSSLLELSHELLHCIFIEITPADLSSLSQTCRMLHSYTRNNRLLHKDLYMRRYDEPQRPDHDVDWEGELHQLVTLEKMLQSGSRERKAGYLGFVSQQAGYLIENARTDQENSRNLHLLSKYFTDTVNLDVFLCSSGLFERAGNGDQVAASTPALRQASAKLHCLFGVPICQIPSRASYSRERPDVHLFPSMCTRHQMQPHLVHTYARSKVYDLRGYKDANLWGPFMDDGSHCVDWEKVEAIMIVVGFNLNRCSDRTQCRWPRVWNRPFVGTTPNSYVSLPSVTVAPKNSDDEMVRLRELALGLDAQDPYGVSGTWMRVVCFLDYNDLYAFNFGPPIPDDQPRPPIDTEEGIINLEESLRVTRIEPPGSDDEDDLDWGRFRGERLPIVHFRGTSRSLQGWDPNAQSRIRGTVRQTPEGEIHWTMFSIFHGEERWRSEGIQVGGLRSARGVLGNWFDKDYDEYGPAGPMACWKLTDDVDEDRMTGMAALGHGFIH